MEESYVEWWPQWDEDEEREVQEAQKALRRSIRRKRLRRWLARHGLLRPLFWLGIIPRPKFILPTLRKQLNFSTPA